MNDCLMIDSYVCGLNSELFLHTVKQKSICIMTLYLFMFALYIDLGMSSLTL